MIRVWVIAVVFLLSGVLSASAQQRAGVQSGEHDRFSRIVFPVPSEVSWTVETELRSATVRFTEFNGSFDTSKVMDSLSSGRVRSLSAENGEIIMTLGCNCEVDVFRFDDRFVVVDVFQSENVEQAETAEPIDLPPLLTEMVGSAPYTDLFLPFERNEDLRAVPPDEVTYSETRLAEQVANAVSSELLSPSGRIAPRQEAVSPRAVDQVEIKTPFRNAMPQRTEEHAGICSLTPIHDITQWPERAEIWKGLGALRREVYDEKGSPAGASDLSHAYIMLGFGAEARALQDLSLNRPALSLDLAHVVDGVPSPSGSPLRKAYGCPNAMAFWAVLSAGALPHGVELNESAVEVTLASMHREYRKVYAPTVIARLRAAGYEASARRIEGLLARSGDANAFEFAVLDRAALASMPLEDRFASLREMAFSNGAVSLQALRILLEEHATARIALDDALLTFAGSFVETVEDKEDRIAIHAGLLFGLLLSEYPFEAIQDYERFLHTYPEHAVHHVDTMVALATDVLPDNDYALFIVGLEDKMPAAHIDPETSLAVARRMIAVGMPSKALEVMARRDLDNSDEKRLLSAQAYLAMGDPAGALARIAQMPGPAARKIRAHAYLYMGHYDKAFPYLELQDPLREAAGWIAQVPDADHVQSPSRQALRKQMEEARIGRDIDPEAATTTEVIERASAMRDTISQLMRE